VKESTMFARITMLVALVAVAAGCGGGDPCAGSPCPNDTRPTQQQYQDCVSRHQARMNDRCNAQSVNIELCAQQNTVCNSSGKTDFSATQSRYSTNCKQATDALICCLLSSTACR